jgi:hypothetical protein
MIPRLITAKTGLNYCCLWAFFTLFQRTGVIAERLGVSRQAVQRYRRRYREGCYRCEQRDKCLLRRLTDSGKRNESAQ